MHRLPFWKMSAWGNLCHSWRGKLYHVVSLFLVSESETSDADPPDRLNNQVKKSLRHATSVTGYIVFVELALGS